MAYHPSHVAKEKTAKHVIAAALKGVASCVIAGAMCFYSGSSPVNIASNAEPDGVSSQESAISSDRSYETVTSQMLTSSVESIESSSKSSTSSRPKTPGKTSSKSSSSSSKPSTSTTPSKPVVVPVTEQSDEMRAVWISYLEFEKILKGKTESSFKSAICGYFDNCVSNGLNTVVVQVRSHCDALYPSAYFPTSVYFTGQRTNKAPFDPLSIMIKAAHDRGLRLEAWTNPLRGPKTKDTLAASDPIARWKGTDKVFEYNGSYYMDPGQPEVRQLIINGIKEIMQNYDVDGIHFDDRFYPTSSADIDSASFAAYGNGRTLSKFRLDNINGLVSEVYRTIKTTKKITFGISPQGNVDNNYTNCFADVKLWGSKPGYVDYLAPQLYWSYGEGSLPFEKALAKWQGIVTAPGIKLVAGLAAYKVGTNSYWSSGDVLSREITDSRKSKNSGGFILFRYDNYFSTVCDSERQNIKALLSK